jgi:hypothetical protein
MVAAYRVENYLSAVEGSRRHGIGGNLAPSAACHQALRRR